MRQTKYFEAYLDDFNKVIVYMSKDSYGGVSKFFYLRDTDDGVIDLHIQSIEATQNNYNKYVLTLKQPIEIGREYYVVHQHARATILQYSGIVKTEHFDELFYYEGNDLGYTYTQDETSFALWAPTAARVKLEIEKHGRIQTYEMQRSDYGVFRYTLNDQLENATYVYMVRVHGVWLEAIDPYGNASIADAKRSAIIDLHKLKMQKYPLPPMKSACDAILYEASVRDFTMQRDAGINERGTFRGFVEENAITQEQQTGFSYLKALGITHVQLMPVLDFGSIDEVHPSKHYNWGYDPMQYRVLEGSYGIEPYNPYDRIFGLMNLVEECHKAGIRVNLDMVFNHVYDKETHAFEKTVPNYYFQMNEHGDFSNGSFCGNDVDTSRQMCSKYVVDACRFLVETYHIDGMRFDLMGILDVDTMNRVYQECSLLNPDFMLYGEGWDMPSFLAPERRASIGNNALMPHVGHFSDRFRDVVKGRTSFDEVHIRGYCTGASYLVETMKNCLCASSVNIGMEAMFSDPRNAVNYVECHDNMTCWDKIKECCHEEDKAVHIAMHEMMIASVLMAQGIPFIHSGQEFARTKHGKPNTYNDSDEINMLDWKRCGYYQHIITCTKELIKIRKKYACLRYAFKEDVEQHVYFDVIQNKALVYRVEGEGEELIVIFNPTYDTFSYQFDQAYELIYDNGALDVANIMTHSASIQPYHTMIFASVV